MCEICSVCGLCRFLLLRTCVCVCGGSSGGWVDGTVAFEGRATICRYVCRGWGWGGGGGMEDGWMDGR